MNLTDRDTAIIPTSRYQEWVGGHGMGSALFFDLVRDKTIDGFDPANVITLMTSPLTGTLTPAGAARTEVQGIGVQSVPIGWFTRSNFGGRFSTMLKSAGWDGIAIEGQADEPVWLDIRNSEATIRNCSGLSLWGTDTMVCQQRIWGDVAGGRPYGGWVDPGAGSRAQTTQRPAVLAIGPAGENLSRMACLIHDASNSAGQGGFGAVWGAKRLKAISVMGTGGIHVSDPAGLVRTRLWQQEKYAFDLKNPEKREVAGGFHSAPYPVALYIRGRPPVGQRAVACLGCHSGCRGRYEDFLGNEAKCFGSIFYTTGNSLEIQRKACDLLNRYGLNAAEMFHGDLYLRELDKLGVLGPGRAIDCPLDYSRYGSLEYAEQLVKAIAYRNDGRGRPHPFGDDLAEGFVRAAGRWGRLDGDEGDLKTGLLSFPFWGCPAHMPLTQVDWSYGTILGDRDINEHDFNAVKYRTLALKTLGKYRKGSAGKVVKIYTDKMVPFQGDMAMLDFSRHNRYSEHIAKLVAWHRYYTRFWKQSALFCDFRWPDFFNPNAPGDIGSTGISEPKFLNAVTGGNTSFLDGIQLGRKIWNLDHAIWTLQGRHRDLVHFADYVYTRKAQEGRFLETALYLPGRVNKAWNYVNTTDEYIDKSRFEGFKSLFYRLQGWEESTGYPTKSTLTSLGLASVADELEQCGRLGKG